MVGQSVSHYTVIEKLGEGGMGVVYKARDTKLDRPVALKFLPPYLAADEHNKSRFVEEARAASSLDHPNICNVHEIGETDDGQLFIAMALYDGGPLNRKTEQAPLPIGEALDIAIQLAQGLRAAHESGIVHRDVKSSNIIVTGTGRVVIMDFGLARASARVSLTKTGETVGTVPYMSPEQARGDDLDQRTDMWSLGVVLYEMIVGRRPFRSEYQQALVYSILNEDPEPITSLRSDVPMELGRIVTKALQKDRAVRYQTAGDILTDLTGLRRALESSPGPQIQTGRARRRMPSVYLYGSIIALTVAALGVAYVLFTARVGTIDSIAVLPLDNLTGDPAQEYFVDGMHEALIAELSKISTLKVISRTSAMQYKGVKKPPMPEIARELGVKGLVEGSVMREANQVQITVQLINGPKDEHLWAASYKRELYSILALHTEVAEAIANNIRATLTRKEQLLSTAHTVDPIAYDAYLQARYYWYLRTVGGYNLAITHFRKAAEIDPRYAPAYAGLAEVYMQMGEQGVLPQQEARSLAGTAVEKALELGRDLGETQAALAHFEADYEMNWPRAESAFQRASELNPGDSFLQARYARFLAYLGRFDEAIERLRQARNLDPLSVLAGAYTGQVYLFARRYDLAEQELLRTVQLSPDHALVRHNLGELYLAESRFVEAIQELEKSVKLSAGDSEVASSHYLAMLGCAYARASRQKDAADVLNELSRRYDQKLASAFDMASLQAALGDNENALATLERGYEDRDLWLMGLGVWPWFDSLRDDPRFQSILDRIGLSTIQSGD